MKFLFTTACKPIPIFLSRFLSIDQTSFRFVVDQDLFNVTSETHSYALHFLAQNINVPSVILEWPTLDELAEELQSDNYDYVGINFRPLDINKLPDMIDCIRKNAPGAKIILGGYGTICLEDLEEEGIYLRDKVDYVCRGEGVAFLRTLIGDTEKRPITCHLPTETHAISWLPKHIHKKVGYLLSALGCEEKCEFCVTSAFTDGKVVEVMTASEIFEGMKWYYENHPDFDRVFLMDENFLDYREKVNELGTLIREDESLGLSNMKYVAFGTVSAVSDWEPDELLLNGVSDVWTGVESFFSYDRKKKTDVKELVKTLHKHGIQTILSWIIGDDCQTQDNINEDIEQFISLKSPASQIASLISCPGTPLYKRLKQEGRAKSFIPEEMHLFGNSMDSLHFSYQERIDILFSMYRRIYETNGPSIMRATKIDMNGYRHCSNSKNPYLSGPKLELFKRKVKNSIILIKVAIEFAPNLKVRKLMQDLWEEYVELFAPFTKSQNIIADNFLSLAEKEYQRREMEGFSLTKEIPLQEYMMPATEHQTQTL